MNIVALQFDIAWENKSANFEKVRQLLVDAAPEKNSLVALPEMFATGFSMNVATIAEAYGGETERFLAATAKQFGIYLVGGAAMRGRDGRARNKALVFGPDGQLISFYAKMRPFSPGGESQHYFAGEHPVAFNCGDCAVSPFICYDLRFPELFRQSASSHKPELFVVIANWPEKRIAHWTRLLQARAIENQAYIMAANRIGQDPYYHCTGHSLIADFDGEIICEAGEKEGVIRAELDLGTLRKYRKGLPFLQDMKPAVECTGVKR